LIDETPYDFGKYVFSREVVEVMNLKHENVLKELREVHNKWITADMRKKQAEQPIDVHIDKTIETAEKVKKAGNIYTGKTTGGK